jgi:hypothetical protein
MVRPCGAAVWWRDTTASERLRSNFGRAASGVVIQAPGGCIGIALHGRIDQSKIQGVKRLEKKYDET